MKRTTKDILFLLSVLSIAACMVFLICGIKEFKVKESVFDFDWRLPFSNGQKGLSFTAHTDAIWGITLFSAAFLLPLLCFICYAVTSCTGAAFQPMDIAVEGIDQSRRQG